MSDNQSLDRKCSGIAPGRTLLSSLQPSRGFSLLNEIWQAFAPITDPNDPRTFAVEFAPLAAIATISVLMC